MMVKILYVLSRTGYVGATVSVYETEGGNGLRVSFFHLLDGYNFRMGGHGEMIGLRDIRNDGQDIID